MLDMRDALLLGEEFIQDSHTVAAGMRETTPVRFAVLPGGFPVWLVTGYAEARAVMTDARFSSHRVYDRLERLRIGPDAESSFSDDLVMNLLNLDPPDHTRLRKLVAKAFTTRSVEPMRERIEQITDELLDAMAGKESVEFLADFAYPLPIQVICELLGVPFADRDDFVDWSRTMVAATTPEEIGAASMRMAAYLGDLVEAKRIEPTADLLSELVHVSADGDRLSRRELIATAVVLLTGGFETTVNLLSSGLLALLRHPDQLALLRADRSLLRNAVEEFLRYETPNNLSSPRYTTEDVELGGVRIPEGHFVMVSWLAANRSDRFAEPDRLDITRAAGGHLAFGHGMHYCVGAPLARLEGEIAFDRLLGRFTEIELVSTVDSLRWRHSTAMHGLETLTLRLR
ncbi:MULTISPECIES: cytochrome P450 [unclassified Crossiella]|uniref:cytochrome P450 family protein n=1 Tax=unclassified Crossiella TaxID=2620835 RepID=UPI001FFE7A63|nr:MULTISPECIES: cytochrome P450 [unclassified Crossiella]MCK2244646.1 cytochrome P450 [Crossiella sp. S99.2]MCK2258367.1 cytochrome P450 [Crossiella sp. S99.1]